MESAQELNALYEEVRAAASGGDEATLRGARALASIELTKAHREVGTALLVDLATRLGIPPGRARRLLDLGRALRKYPGLEREIRSRRTGLTRALIAAPAMAESSLSEGVWMKELRRRSSESLRQFVRRQRSSRIIDGVRYQRQYIQLSPEARAMLFDAQARIARSITRRNLPERTALPGRTQVLGKAIDLAAWKVRQRDVPVGVRRYRIAEHPEGSFEVVAGHVGDESILLRAARATFRMDVSPPEGFEIRMARLRERLGIESDDPIEIAEQAGPLDIWPSERRPLAHALVEELKRCVATEDAAWHRVARVLVVLDDMEVDGWRKWVAGAIDRSPSVVSELLSCGRAVRRFPELGESLENGVVRWTHVRTVAPHLDDSNYDTLRPLILACSVRELESLRSALAGRPSSEGRARHRLSANEIELSCETWEALDRLIGQLERRLQRPVSLAEAIEEALWQFLVTCGSPSPLWAPYRILVHRDQGTGVAWLVVQGGLVLVDAEQMTEIEKTSPTVHGLAEAIEAARNGEVARLTERLTEEESILDQVRRAMALPDEVEDARKALRRLIHVRDGCRCSVCGCHAAIFVHVHHREWRSRGGGNDPDNLHLLCTRCHALAHSSFATLVPRTREPSRIFEVQPCRRARRDSEPCRPGVGDVR